MDEDYDLDGVELTPIEEYDFAKAKQRASVLWLVSKAHQNRVPVELREVFYRDQSEQDRLRPQLVQALASGELYCLALANIYADPNYHSLSHQGVVQALQRKGIEVPTPADHCPLTETVLAQTAPLRMSAHMAVINGIMELYIKEVLIPIKVFEVVRRFSAVGYPEEVPVDAEDAALLWLNKCSVKMRHRVEDELGPGPHHPVGGPPMAQELGDLSDGCALAALLSFYCPQHLPWQDLCLPGDSLADSLYNLQLAQRFCEAHLPHDVFFLTVEDVLFAHPSVRQNLLALLADLMFIFEIRPAKCVRRPGLRYDPPSTEHSLQAARHRGESLRKARALQNSCSHIPDLCPPEDHNQAKHNGAWPEGKRRPSQGSVTGNRVLRSVGRDDEDSDQLSSSPRCRSDEEELFLANRRPSSSLRRYSSGALEPLLPARLREPKERSNCDVAKHLERGEDASSSSSPTPHSPARNAQEAMQRVREAEEQGSPAHRVSSSGTLTLRRSTSRSEVGSPLHRSGSRSILGGSEHASPLHRSASKSDVGSPLRRNCSRTDLFQPSVLSRSTSQTDIYGGSPVRRGRLATEPEAKKPSSTLESYYDQLAGGLQKQAGYPLRRESSLSHMYNFSGEKAALEMTDPFETDMFAEHRERTKKAAQTMNFAQLSKLKDSPDTSKSPSGINIVYMQQDGSGSRVPPEKRKPAPTDAAAKPTTATTTTTTTTTWQQQAAGDSEESRADDSSSPLTAQLNNVRLKLEERRRKIEQEKRHMEEKVKKQRQKASKAAFLQAVARGDSRSADSSAAQGNTSSERSSHDASGDTIDSEQHHKWLHHNGSPQPVDDSPQSDDVDLDECVSSIDRLNTSLTDLQADISRLDKQQQAIQNLLRGPQAAPLPPQPQEKFFLHSTDDGTQPQSLPAFPHTPQPYAAEMVQPPFQPPPQRRQWGEYPMQVPVMPPQQQQQQRRGQWGPPVVTLAEQTIRWGAPAAALVDPGYVVYPPSQADYAYHQTPYYQNGNGPPDMRQVGYASFTMPQPQHQQQQQQQPQQQQPLPPPFQIPRTAPNSEPPVMLAATQPESQHSLHTTPQAVLEEQVTEQVNNLSLSSAASPPRKTEFGKTYRVSKGQQPARTQDKSPDDSDVGFFISFDDQQPKKPKPKLRPRISKPEESALSNGSLAATATEGAKGSDGSTNSAPSESRDPSESGGGLGVGFVIGADLVNPDPEAESEMQRRKEMMMLLSLRRREEQEASRVAKEQRNAVKRMQEQLRREEQARKREEDRQRRQLILEQYRQRKAQEEAEKDAAVMGGMRGGAGGDMGATLTRGSSAKPRSSSRPRPKSMHLGPCSMQRGSHTSLDECGRQRAASPPPSGTEWRASASDGASDTASTHSLLLLPAAADYAGPKLFVKPTAKSNRGIIVNAINTVLAGAVNADTKRKVLEEMNVSESKHFLILFRDSGCQFRGLYSYHPDREEVFRLYGVGPRTVQPAMMDMFFKYNSGAKSFTQIHTKHLTVTIDAFTIHNSLWTVKKTCVPQRRDL